MTDWARLTDEARRFLVKYTKEIPADSSEAALTQWTESAKALTTWANRYKTDEAATRFMMGVYSALEEDYKRRCKDAKNGSDRDVL